jgi:hypothetical protein
VTYIYEKGILLSNELIVLSFSTKISILPIKAMISFFLEKVNDAEKIDPTLEQGFQDSRDRLICIDYEIEIVNLTMDRMEGVRIMVKDVVEKGKTDLSEAE